MGQILSYWGTFVEGVFNDTLKWFGWKNKRQFFSTVIILIIAFLYLFFKGKISQLMDEIVWYVALFIACVITFLIIFIINIFIYPAKLDAEKTEKIKKQEDKIHNFENTKPEETDYNLRFAKRHLKLMANQADKWVNKRGFRADLATKWCEYCYQFISDVLSEDDARRFTENCGNLESPDLRIITNYYDALWRLSELIEEKDLNPKFNPSKYAKNEKHQPD